MSYFPAYLSLENKRILIIGGGKIATHKLEKLLEFTNSITIISINISDELLKISQQNSIKIIQKEYQESDLESYDIAIVAIDNKELQREIFFQTRGKNILCNCVDLIECCDFIFPAYIKKDDLVISISTSGTSPAISKYLKKYILEKLPTNLEEFLKSMKECRKSLVKGKERMKILEKRAKEYFDSL